MAPTPGAGKPAVAPSLTVCSASIATSAALSVLYPHMTGLGGDAFWLVHDAETKTVRYLDAAGRAAASASVGWFQERGHDEIPFRGILPATLSVPGAVDGWCTVHDEFGVLPLSRLLAPAAEFARGGFPVTARLSSWINTYISADEFNQDAREIFMPGGTVPAAGSQITNPNLARTIEAVGSGGRDADHR